MCRIGRRKRACSIMYESRSRSNVTALEYPPLTLSSTAGKPNLTSHLFLSSPPSPQLEMSSERLRRRRFSSRWRALDEEISATEGSELGLRCCCSLTGCRAAGRLHHTSEGFFITFPPLKGHPVLFFIGMAPWRAVLCRNEISQGGRAGRSSDRRSIRGRLAGYVDTVGG